MNDAPKENPNGIPGPIATAFHIPNRPGQRLGSEWDYGVLVDQTVVSPVISRDTALLSSRLRESITPKFVRFARPLHSGDGRVVVRGYKATAFEMGMSRTNPDLVIRAALDVEQAISEVEIPRFVDYLPDFGDENKVYRTADFAAWSDSPAEVISTYVNNPDFSTDTTFITALETIAAIFPKLKPIDAPRQLIHADMWGTTLVQASLPPVVTDFYFQAHPAGFSAALVAIDALADGAASSKIITRYNYLPNWEQLLLRALSYRLYASALGGRNQQTIRLVQLARNLGLAE
ncbi:MAG: TIGR02569 family protein [Corynebacterium sp.]|nr:TIGR02569 family protein [Corynebacterium sp.]